MATFLTLTLWVLIPVLQTNAENENLCGVKLKGVTRAIDNGNDNYMFAPWAVSIQYKVDEDYEEEDHLCTGSLIKS